ncbi:BatA domain-containing protein [Opitutales bacterium]|nr:BatA domain-containing protein [Opitutales bacterium]
MMEFGQPLALWTGVAIALPIIAHLAYQRIAHKVSFSSLRFLRSSSIPRTGRRKPSDWLLLILRILLFVLLALLLADPYWQEPDLENPLSSGSSQSIFVIDCSPSMSGWGAWDEMIEKVGVRLQNSADETFGLLATQKGALTEWTVGTKKEELLKAIEELTPQSSALGIQNLIDRSADLFSPQAGLKKVVCVSDFQKSSWQDMAGSFGEAGITIELLPVGHGEAPWSTRSFNRSIVDARVAPLGTEKVRVWTALRNWEDQRSDINVSIFAGGAVRQTIETSLPPLGSQQVQFILPAQDFAQASVSIDQADAYALDDNQSLWVLPPLPRSFGFWKNPSPKDSDSLEQQFLQAAMESAGDGTWIRWQENKERANEVRMGITGPPLELLLVLGLSRWFEDEDLSIPLDSHLQGGGTVLITPPDDSFVAMNQVFKESGMLSFTFGGINQTIPGIDPFRFEVLAEKSELSRVFSGDSARDLYLSQIKQFITVQEDESLEVPLRDRSGKPLVLVRSFPSGGRLIFFTFRMFPQWTDLPLRNSFLPLLVELCALNQKQESLGGAIRLQAGEAMEIGDNPVDTQNLGLFQMGEKRIEVVHPLVESMPEVINQNELTEALVGNSSSVPADLSVNQVKAQSGIPLWPWFALASAILIITEMILSAPVSKTHNSEESASG